MPIDLKYDSATGILYATMDGQVTSEEFENVVKAITTSDEYPPDVPTVWDTRGFDFSTLTEVLMNKYLDVRRRYPIRRRAAIVASSDLGFGMSRMYEILSENFQMPQKLMVFREHSKALDWLLSKPSD